MAFSNSFYHSSHFGKDFISAVSLKSEKIKLRTQSNVHELILTQEGQF